MSRRDMIIVMVLTAVGAITGLTGIVIHIIRG